jgi:hypothetical protein
MLRHLEYRARTKRRSTVELPAPDELNQMVDMEFREQHPTAPERLDPNSAADAPLVAAWGAIRHRKATEWTDDIFASYFPDAGKLDPGDQRDVTLIDFWNDIFHQLVNGPPGKYDWSSFAPTTAAAYRRVDSGDFDEIDPVTPDTVDAIAAIHQARDLLAEILQGTELVDRVTDHLSSQIGEMLRVNVEGGITSGQPWVSEALNATTPDPNAPDDPYFVRDIAITATLNDDTFTIMAKVTGSASGPNGQIEP